MSCPSLCSDGVCKFAWLCVFVKPQSFSEYMYSIICIHIHWQRNFHLEGSSRWWTARVKTISKTLLFSRSWTTFISILVLRWCMQIRSTMCCWELSISKWIYVYHHLRSYLLTKELSFRGIYSLVDSLCQNY